MDVFSFFSLISALYPIDGAGLKPGVWNDAVRFNIQLNTVIVSRNKLRSPHFSVKYPLAINFARLGRDIADTLLSVVDVINQDYLIKSEIVRSKGQVQTGPLKDIRYIPYGNTVAGDSKRCVINKTGMRDPKLPQHSLDNLYHHIRVARITARALAALIQKIDSDQPDPSLGKITYGDLGLTKRMRQPGLREFDELQLYSVAYMQNYCAEADLNYGKWKPYIELELPRRSL